MQAGNKLKQTINLTSRSIWSCQTF